MLVIFGMILWLIVGFCAYIWNIKRMHTTYFSWPEFLLSIGFGVITFIMTVIDEIIDGFPKVMEKLIKKINKGDSN